MTLGSTEPRKARRRASCEEFLIHGPAKGLGQEILESKRKISGCLHSQASLIDFGFHSRPWWITHLIQDREQLSHAGRQHHLVAFAGGSKTIGQGLDHRVAIAGDKGGHEQGSTHSGPSAEDPTLASHRSCESRLMGATPASLGGSGDD